MNNSKNLDHSIWREICFIALIYNNGSGNGDEGSTSTMVDFKATSSRVSQ
jgi:hypothetical protein